MNPLIYYAFSGLFNGLLALFLVYYAFLRNPRNPVNRSFLYFGISVSGWSLFYAGWCAATNPVLAEVLLRTSIFFAAFMPAGFLHFVSHVTGHFRLLRRWKVIDITYFLCATAGVLCFTPVMISGTKSTFFFPYWPKPGFLTSYYVAFSLVIVVFVFCLMGNYARLVKGRERLQVLWILFAFAIGWCGGLTNWFLWFDIPVLPVTNFFVGVTFLILTYAIVKYGLMDVDQLVEAIRNNRLNSMGLLMASINHEIKSPLYIIQNTVDSVPPAEGVTLNPIIEQYKVALKKNAMQAHRALEVIRRFSDFVKKKEPRRRREESVDLAMSIEDVLFLLRPEMLAQGISVQCDVPAGIPGIRGEDRQIEEILFNVFFNACQALKGKGGRISISVNHSSDSVFVSVKDNGPGIASQDMKRLFDPFYSTKRDGTGLGLYIVRQLIEASGGSISAKSIYGRETVFELEFKMA